MKGDLGRPLLLENYWRFAKLAVRCLNAEAVAYDTEADEAMHWSR